MTSTEQATAMIPDFHDPFCVLADGSIFPPTTSVVFYLDGGDNSSPATYVKIDDCFWMESDQWSGLLFGDPVIEPGFFPHGAIAAVCLSDSVVQFVKHRTTQQWLRLRAPETGVAECRRVEQLEQTPYHAQQPPRVPPAFFGGVRLVDVLNSQGAAVQGHGLPAYDSLVVKNDKLSIRFEFPGVPLTVGQVTVKRSQNKVARYINRGELAVLVAEKLKAFMGSAAGAGTLKHQGVAVEFTKLVLLEVKFPSKGTAQPHIGVEAA